jgi:hypothetical protein
MPIDPVRALVVRDAVGQVLWDAPLYQGIFNVSLARAPTRVRFDFFTFWPCFARIEIFRMVHGELSLDMEKEHLVRTEIELFGSAKERHSILVTGLEQERRYWYRISVPRKTPQFPNATGHARYRGEFFTPRRNTTVTINRIHVFDDSDTSGDGELEFSLGLYNAGNPRNLLVAPRLSPEFGVASGKDIPRPFGPGGQSIGRAPDFIGVYVFGVDDDATIWGAPWYGLGLVGRHPPDIMPESVGTWSRTYADMSEALHVFATGGKMGRQQGSFDFNSVHGRLHYSVHGGFVTEVFDTLRERATPPWKMVKKSTMALDAGGRAAGLVGLEDGPLVLALDPEGRLARAAADSRGEWQTLEGPPLDSLVAKATRRGAIALTGCDLDGIRHADLLRAPREGQPCWSALGRAADAAPALLEDRDGNVRLVFVDSRGRPWTTLLVPGARPATAPTRLLPDPIAAVALHGDERGRTVVVLALAAGGLVTLSLDETGRPAERWHAAGEPLRVLAIADEDDQEPLLVAIDREERVAVRPLALAERPLEVVGTLEDLLEGLDLGEPTEPRQSPPHAA